jgi:metallo-beta-lactamase family protein
VKVFKEWVPVQCDVRKISFSAHADYQELLSWLAPLDKETPPRHVFVTHGEAESATAMVGHLKERFGWEASVPHYGQRFEL